ncbi:MAG: FxsA family protein [Halobacteriaceae archaeon]
MFKRALLLLLVVPLLDMVLLVVLADRLGWEATVAIVVLTALVGMILVRAEGRRTLGKLQRSVARGDPPQDHLIDGGLLLAAGAFLLTPGLVTDGLGLLLTVPPTRALARMALKRYVIVPALDRRTGGIASGSIYVGGFPGSDDGDQTVDLGPDDYEVDDE